jgi:hypothetical protein
MLATNLCLFIKLPYTIYLKLNVFFFYGYTVLKEILATRFLKGKFNWQGGSVYTQNVALAA